MEHSDDNETKTEYFSTPEYSGGEMYAYNNAPPPVPKEPSTRPGIVSFICILGFIATGIGLLIGMSSLLDNSPEWQRPYMILGAVVTLVGYIGVWNMKLWGLYILVLMFVVSLIVAYAMHLGFGFNLVGSALILLILGLQSKKME